MAASSVLNGGVFMPDFEAPRIAVLNLVYEGTDISADIAPYLLSFTYTDKASGEADDIQIVLEDKDSRWIGNWFPNKGDTINASITLFNWDKNNQNIKLPCGSFEIDEIEISYPPTVVTIKGVSVLVTTSAVGQKKTTAWESLNLKSIANEIAQKNNMKLFYDAALNPIYERKDQVKTSDLTFLQNLCFDAGLAIKCTSSQIVIYSEEEYEDKAPVATISKGDARIISVSLRSKTAGTYSKANVAYHDPIVDETIEAEASSEDAPDNGKTLEINQRVKSQAEAESLAEEQLRQANKNEVSGRIDLTGLPNVVGGSVVVLSGWGKFDGKYFVESAAHTYSESGYLVSIEINETGASKGGKKAKNKKVSMQHESLLS
ncbi:MAG: hypothetical protein PHO93_03710 [Candidatus Saccharimonadaceae bacterium]|nr:hypothetical protein [Candidatus Saccharimonadaceae bacterium]